jgi:hypothetical protein
LGKSAHCGEKFQQIRRSLAGTIIAEIVPEVRVLFFTARLIEQVRVPFDVGGSAFNELPRQETVMKSVAFFVMVLCALIIGSVSWQTKASNTARKQSAVTTFDRAVVVHGVTLKGEYLFVHDDAAMQLGEACTYVYEGNAPISKKLVVSFHCVPIERAKAKHFIVRSVETSPGITELQEFQFAGDTEEHAVPTSIDQHVNVRK